MKISRLRIKNLFGIKEYSGNGKSVELVGENGTGKTSIIDAIRLALTNRSNRDYIIKSGESEGEVLIETDNGLSIDRIVRTGKSDFKSIKSNGKEVQSPEAFLRELFTELQLNPVEFLAMDAKEQNRIILNMIDFKWDLNWIKEQFGEIVPNVNYELSILEVLHQIQAEDGYYFLKRQDINREARNKQAFVEEIGLTLPPNYEAEKWEKANLGELYKKVEAIRVHNQSVEFAKQVMESQESKIRGFEAKRDIEIAALDRETTSRRNAIEKDIEKLKAQIAALETEAASLEEKRQDKLKVIEQTFRADVAKHEAFVSKYREDAQKQTIDASELEAEAENVEKMKSFINEYRRMLGYQEEVEKLKKQSEALTEKIEKARTLPGEILKVSKLPIEGLSIKDGKPLIHGLPINNLSEGEKLNLCIDVAARSENQLNLVLIDGVEKLSSENRNRLYGKCKEKGIQFVATRTTDDKDLLVVEV